MTFLGSPHFLLSPPITFLFCLVVFPLLSSPLLHSSSLVVPLGPLLDSPPLIGSSSLLVSSSPRLLVSSALVSSALLSLAHLYVIPARRLVIVILRFAAAVLAAVLSASPRPSSPLYSSSSSLPRPSSPRCFSYSPSPQSCPRRGTPRRRPPGHSRPYRGRPRRIYRRYPPRRGLLVVILLAAAILVAAVLAAVLSSPWCALLTAYMVACLPALSSDCLVE